jgi:hypothetical protein
MPKELEPFDIKNIGLSRHGHQYAESTLFRAWIAATLNPLINVQDAFLSLLEIDVDTAEGVKLDLIGRIVGAPAAVPNAVAITGYFGFVGQDNSEAFGEFGDDDWGGDWQEIGYPSFNRVLIPIAMQKTIIKAQILKNKSLCTPNDIIAITKLLLGDTIGFSYIEEEMIIAISPDVDVSLFTRELLRLMLPIPMGVGFAVVGSMQDDFGFKDQPSALPFGDTDNPTIGGYWSTYRQEIEDAKTGVSL